MPDDLRQRAGIAERNGHVPATPATGLTGRVLIGERIAGGAEPPAQLVKDVLYRGRLHAVNAPAGEGKTLLALWAGLEVLRQGLPVVYLDAENGPAVIAERLKDLGADPAMLDGLLHYYPSPEIALDAGALDALSATAEAVRPALAVFDSLPDFLAVAGANENDATDVTRWMLAIPQLLKDSGCAVILLDHVAKAAEGRGRYARGSGAKLAKVDVSWSLLQTVPFDRGRVGEIELKLHKDREAYLPACQKFAVGGAEGGRLVFRRADGVIEETGTDGLTDGARRALKTLEAGDRDGASGLSFTGWMSAANMAKTTFRRAMNDLLARGLAQKRGQRYHPRHPVVEGPRPVAPDPRGHGAGYEDPPPSKNPRKIEGPQGPRPQHGPTGTGYEGPQAPPPYRGGTDGSSPAPPADDVRLRQGVSKV